MLAGCIVSPAAHLLATPAAAEGRAANVRSVDILGNSAFSTRDLLDLVTVRPGDSLGSSRLSESRRLLEDRYRAAGYLGVRVPEPACAFDEDSSTAAVTFQVDEGRRTVIGRITFRGVKGVSAARAASRFESSVGAPLQPAVLESDLAALLEDYERAGYPYARAAVSRLDVTTGGDVDSLEVVVSVEEGNHSVVGEIRVEGVVETSPDVVEREARGLVGEPYDPRAAESIRRRLSRLAIFSSVAEPELYERGSGTGILFRVTEGTSNTFDGIIGYQPAASGGGGDLTGLVSVGLRNLFGTGRRLNVRWQRDARSSQELAFRYLEPWLFGWPFNTAVGFFQRQQDSAYVRRVLDGTVEVVLSDAILLGAGISAEQVIPSASASTARVSRSSSTSATVSFRYDTRDDLLSPEGGLMLLTDFSYGRKRLTEPASASLNAGTTSLQRYRTDLEFYTGFVARQVVAVGLHGRQVKGAAIEESDMVRFGGATTLRGYRELQFLATLALWANAEYRLLTGRRSFVYAFVDPGYYSRSGSALPELAGVEEFLLGYGIGIRTDTPLGVIGVSFALGKGDAFSEGKVHVGLVNEF
jgi:outer membrane protein insertion porin family